MALRTCLTLLCLLATPLAADPCLPDDVNWPDTDIAFLEQAIETQQDVAQNLFEAGDPQTAMTCAWQASDSSAHLLRLAVLARIEALSHEGNLLRQIGSLEAANGPLSTAATLIETHFLADDRAATNAALTAWALPMARLIEARTPDRALPAYTQIHSWAQCAKLFVPDPAEIRKRIAELGGTVPVEVSQDTCAQPLTLTAFR